MFGKNINDKKFVQRQQYKQLDNDYYQDLIVTVTDFEEN